MLHVETVFILCWISGTHTHTITHTYTYLGTLCGIKIVKRDTLICSLGHSPAEAWVGGRREGKAVEEKGEI